MNITLDHRDKAEIAHLFETTYQVAAITKERFADIRIKIEFQVVSFRAPTEETSKPNNAILTVLACFLDADDLCPLPQLTLSVDIKGSTPSRHEFLNVLAMAYEGLNESTPWIRTSKCLGGFRSERLCLIRQDLETKEMDKSVQHYDAEEDDLTCQTVIIPAAKPGGVRAKDRIIEALDRLPGSLAYGVVTQ